jgi:hypothetical protein
MQETPHAVASGVLPDEDTSPEEHPLTCRRQRFRWVNDVHESLVDVKWLRKVGDNVGTSNLKILSFVLWHSRSHIPGENDQIVV